MRLRWAALLSLSFGYSAPPKAPPVASGPPQALGPGEGALSIVAWAGQQETLPVWIFNQLTKPRQRPVTNVVAVSRRPRSPGSVRPWPGPCPRPRA